MFISKYKFIVQRVGEVAFYMKIYFYLLVGVGGVLCGCKDDFISSDRDDAYIYIQLDGMMSRARSLEGEIRFSRYVYWYSTRMEIYLKTRTSLRLAMPGTIFSIHLSTWFVTR